MKLSSKTRPPVPETLSELGLSITVNPAVEIRVRYRFSKWWVQYRRPGVMWRWFWLTDSGHENFQDARLRAQTIAERGGFETLGYQELHFDVDQYNGTDSLAFDKIDDELLTSSPEADAMDWYAAQTAEVAVETPTQTNTVDNIEPVVEAVPEPEPVTETVSEAPTVETSIPTLQGASGPPPNFGYLVRGDCIKVQDARPSSPVVSIQGHENSYIVGIINTVGTVNEDSGRSYRAFTVDCIYDSNAHYVGSNLVSRAGSKIHVPISLPDDYAGRIQKI